MQRDEGSKKPAPQTLCQASGRASHRRKETNQMRLEHTSREEQRAAAMIAHPAGKGIPVSDEVWDRETDEALALLVKHTPAVELVPVRRVLGEGFVLALLILVMCFAEPILGGLA